MSNTRGLILLAEDDASIRRSLHATLSALGFEIGEASSGEEALRRLRMVSYDAVLMDLNMPGRPWTPEPTTTLRSRFGLES